MRLQLSIERHTLPPTQILFSTASYPSAHTSARNATIADLLHDVNDLIPLESADGEWGLEDYIVEVAATADQDNIYEALHFQSIDSVLSEDDEVVIRYLKSEELRGRRYGGRLQITGDGRHLVDGVVWGRRWLGASRAGGRPGINIPPRKRRRILATEADDEVEVEEPLLAIIGENEQDEDEYVDDGEVDENEIKVVSTFDDADEGEAEDEMEDVEDDEVQLLLKEAAEVDDANLDESQNVVEMQLRSRTRLGKRKRGMEGVHDEEDDLEAFSTPVKSPARRQVRFEDGTSEPDSDADSMLAGIAAEQTRKVQGNQTPDDEDDESSASENESSSGTSSSESDNESASDDAGEVLPSPRRTAGRDTDTSSSDSSESESDSDSSGYSSDATSSSGSDSSETSSSSDSETSERAMKASVSVATKTTSSPRNNTTLAAFQQGKDKLAGSVAPPGQGKSATRSKNQRNKMVRHLKRLKEEGLLPAQANFDDLRAYQATLDSSQPPPAEESSQLEAARTKALAIVQESEPTLLVQLDDGEREVDTPEPSRDTESYQPTAESKVAERPAPIQQPDESPKSAPGSSAKRSRLDVAASRRLLFGSLGLRNPKTPAEEQALREKLGKSTNSTPTDRRTERSNSPPPRETHQVTTDDSWKDKLIISAVECTREGVSLDPPPFPFQQISTKRKLKVAAQEPELDYGDAEPLQSVQQPDMRFQDVPDPAERLKLKKLKSSLTNFTVRECYDALRKCDWDHDDAMQFLFSAEVEASQPIGGARNGIQETHQAEEVSDNGSRTVSFAKDEVDGIPIPTDFDALADLEKTHLLPGAVIAYKELWVDPYTVQPDVSPYRVARVNDFDAVCVTLTLAVRDREKPRPRDPETGEVIVNNFEIRTSEDGEVDHGVREVEFAQMMTPKLIEMAVQVPGSSAVPNLRGGYIAHESQHHSSEVVPESLPTAQEDDLVPVPKLEVQQIEIDTPRRKEITTLIREAGFNSSMNEELLEPLSSRGNEPPTSLQPEVYDDAEPSIVVEVPIQPAIAEMSQAQTNDWSSSPLLPQNSTPAQPDEENAPALDNVQPTSSPPVSPQLTVEYPHISQMDLDSSFHAPIDSSKNSSSHQDAQRVPAVPAADVTLTITEENEESFPVDEDEDVHFGDDLQSEVPQSQSQEPSNLQPLSEPNDDEAPTPRTSTFLGRRGVDGPASSPSFHDSNDESENPDEDDSGSESSLPSLTELTSSQRRKIDPKAVSKSTLSKRVSPPPMTRKGLRSRDAKEKIGTRKSLTPPKKLQNSFDGADDSDLDLPPSSQPEPASSLDPLQRDIKITPSQKGKRMSQIPLGTQVVDLTISSDPVSPSDSDSEHGSRNRRASSKTKANRIGVGKARGKKSMLGASMSDLGAGRGVGIGTRRFLTSKKSRSQI